MSRLPVYFVRHKFSKYICNDLKANSLVAYNYLDEYHENLNEYSEVSRGLTQTFNAFQAMARDGAIVVGEYDNPTEFIVGIIDPGSVVARHDFDGSIYKVLKIRDQKTYSYSDRPILAAIRPPYATACGTGRSFSQIIKHIYLGERIELATDFMHPSSIELMCEAFLRSDLAPESVRLKYTLLRTGKTMPAVDIYGVTIGDRKLYAQVTYGSELPAKTKDLVEFASGRGITVLFSKDRSVSARGLDHHFCIDDVFGRFMGSGNPDWKTMIEEMVGITSKAS